MMMMSLTLLPPAFVGLHILLVLLAQTLLSQSYFLHQMHTPIPATPSQHDGLSLISICQPLREPVFIIELSNITANKLFLIKLDE